MANSKINNPIKNTFVTSIGLICSVITAALCLLVFGGAAFAVDNPQTGGFGLQGKVSAPPPKDAPTIASPQAGQTIANLPATVTGTCTGTVLVKLFKNNVFSGSDQCKNNSYSISTDLFTGANELIVRGYDQLDQASPSSNTVVVTYNVSATEIFARLVVTTNYTKQGANPQQYLTWPVIISGGVGPYAISVDWGDGTAADIYSVTTAGEFLVKHKYQQPGVYRVLLKAVDTNGAVTYLQLTAIANGELTGQANASTQNKAESPKVIVLWQPALVAVPLVAATFWLGKKHELLRIKKKVLKGQDPF